MRKQIIQNQFRYRRIGERFLATAEHGAFHFFMEKEFKKFCDGRLKNKPLIEKGFFITNSNRERIKSLLKSKKKFLSQGTSLHIIVVTLRCNEKCIYCHASSRGIAEKGFDMDIKTAKKVVDFIFQTPSKNISIEFQGGEPLLNFNVIKYIATYANSINKKKKKNLLMTLVTNMSLMTRERLRYLVRKRIGICTSLDGTMEIHQLNRPCSDYEKVAYWINAAREEYVKQKIDDRRINALLTVTKKTLPYPREIVDSYLQLGLDGIHIRFLNKLGYALEQDSAIGYKSSEFIKFWKTALDYIIDLNYKGIHFKERMAYIMLLKIFAQEDPNYLDLRSPCGAVIGQLAYNYNGDIYSCDEARMLSDDTFKLGNIHDINTQESASYFKIVSSQKSCSIISSSINDTQFCDFCAYKPYCGVCPVCNYAEHGSVITPVPHTRHCQIYKAMFTYIFEKLSDEKARQVFSSWLSAPIDKVI
ncbi:MAG: His-Xaa-Ser system radical SAM maturase HxsB [Candidatus Woesearchaeota archaeon]